MTSESSQSTTVEIKQQIAQLTRIAVYEQAAELASQGDLTAAEHLLGDLLNDPAYPPAFDLLARIYVEQGNFADAKIAWDKLLAIEPENKGAQRALEKIEERQNNRTTSKQEQKNGVWWITGLITLVTFVMLGWLIIGLQNNLTVVQAGIDELKSAIAPTSTAQPNTDIAATMDAALAAFAPTQETRILAQMHKLQQTQASELISTLQPAQPALRTTRPTAADLGLSISGVTTHEAPEGIEIGFEEGLFLYESLLRPEARELLRQVGYILETVSAEATIEITGFGDDLEAENIALPMNRAVKVASFIVEETDFPDRQIFVQPTGDNSPPFRNDNLENRMRNRTVIIFIRWSDR